MNHIGKAMRLKPGCSEEYKRRHDELWPEMVERMNALEISMVIYQLGDILFVHGAAPTADAWKAMAADPITPRWNQYMAEVLETDENGEIVFHELSLAFSFGKYAEKKEVQ
jgi:L-rhamnose mutarotase